MQQRIRVSTMISSSFFNLPRRSRFGGLAERLLDVLLQFILTQPAKLAVHDFAGTIDEKIHRQSAVTGVELHRIWCSQQDRVVQSHPLREIGDHLVAYFGIHVDSYDLESLWPILLLQFSDPGHFSLAGLTISGPKINQHGFALQLGKLHGLSVAAKDLQIKFRSNLARCVARAQTASLRAIGHVLAGKKQNTDGHDGDQNIDSVSHGKNAGRRFDRSRIHLVSFRRAPQELDGKEHNGNGGDPDQNVRNVFYSKDVYCAKSIQKSQLGRKPGEAPGHEQDSNRNQENAADDFHGVQVATKTAVEPQEAVNAEGGEKEWHREPHGINEKQHHALGKSFFRGCKGHNRSENRTNAGTPAEGERKTNYKRSQRPLSTFQLMQARVRVEPFDLENPRQVQSKKNNDCSADYGKEFLIGVDKLAKPAGHRS